MATTSDRLKAAAAAMPVLDAEAAKRAREAQQVQIAAGLAAAPANAGARGAQQIAPSLTAAVGGATNTANAAAAQTAAQLGQLGQQVDNQAAQTGLERRGVAQAGELANAERAQALTQSAADREQKLDFTAEDLAQQERMQAQGLDVDSNISYLSRKQREDLSKLGRDVKGQLFDANLAFQRDENGRKFSNERQMWAYTVASAQSDEQLKGRMQKMSLAYDREGKMMEIAFAKASQKLEQDYKLAKQKGDQASMAKIGEIKAAMQREADKAKKKAGNKAMIAQGLTVAGGIAGAAAGSVLMPGAGTYVGAAAGSAAGAAAGGAVTGAY